MLGLKKLLASQAKKVWYEYDTATIFDTYLGSKEFILKAIQFVWYLVVLKRQSNWEKEFHTYLAAILTVEIPVPMWSGWGVIFLF